MVRRWVGLGIGAAAVVAAATAMVSARQLAPRPVPEWIERLESPERVAGLKIDYIIASLGLKPGTVVADIGAGPGVLTLPIARTVAPATVYAVEIEQPFLDHIKEKAQKADVKNIVTVLGAFTDPKLPARDADVVLFHDVLHHIKERAAYLKATAQYVKPGGRIAVVELPPDGSHKDQPELVVTKDQVKGWMADAGFKPIQEFNGLTGKWFVVYGRQ